MNQHPIKLDASLYQTLLSEVENKKFRLSHGYISGLTQSDGSFFCSIIKSPKHRFGLQFRPRFTITADLNSKFVLESIKLFLNCGTIYINNKNYTAEFMVDKINDLHNIIIPHFTEYPVFCEKLYAFELFKQIVIALYNKDKRSIEGRRELLKLSLSMNLTNNRTDDRIESLYSLLDVTEKKDKELLVRNISNNEIDVLNQLSNEHIAGIIDGDGSFYISFQTNGKIKTGFNITNDINSRNLLEKIKTQLNNIGSIHEGTKNELVYTVTGINQIINDLIPFMELNPIYSEKALHYEKFKITSLILKNEQPLTLESKLKIVELAYNMNKKGKRRMMSKLEYIELLKSL